MKFIKTVSFDHRDLALFPNEGTPVTLQMSVYTRTDIAGVIAIEVNGTVYSMRFSWNCSPDRLPRLRGHNLAPAFVYTMQQRVRDVLTHWVGSHLMSHAGQGQTGLCSLAAAEYISRLLVKGHLRMPCIKVRATVPHLCTGTIVNKALVPESEAFTMAAAIATINRVARDFVSAHGLQVLGFHNYIRACFGTEASEQAA